MNTAKQSAPFIVFDGLDGSGKGTQLGLLMARAEREGNECILTREPGGAPLSESLRELFKSDLGSSASALTQFLILWASRRNYLQEVVWTALDRNIPVFSDRGDSSTLAYQVYAKNAPELEAEFWHHRRLVFGDRAPSLYIFIDVPPEIARQRSLGDASHNSAFDGAPLEWYKNVRKGFGKFAEHPNVKMISIDGNRPPQEIHEDIWKIVSRECGW